jgi:predicted porin
VKIPTGDFTAKLLNLRGSYSFSTRLGTYLLVQYNSLDDEFSTNLRVNFIHRPGSDLYLVFTEQRGVGTDTWKVSDRAAVVKLTYLKRF